MYSFISLNCSFFMEHCLMKHAYSINQFNSTPLQPVRRAYCNVLMRGFQRAFQVTFLVAPGGSEATAFERFHSPGSQSGKENTSVHWGRLDMLEKWTKRGGRGCSLLTTQTFVFCSKQPFVRSLWPWLVLVCDVGMSWSGFFFFFFFYPIPIHPPFNI